MSRLKEKMKAIKHIITDDEYVIYTVTVKNYERVKGRSCCLISDNASDVFLQSIVEFTEKYRKEKIEGKQQCP